MNIVAICPVCGKSIDFFKEDPIIENEKFYHVTCYYSSSYSFVATGTTDVSLNEKVKIKKRDSWNVYFMKLADFVSSRATCDRKHCGTVITKNNRVVATGYNGSATGEPHCDDVGHFMVNNSCKRTVHAEINAIMDAKTKLQSLEGCILYTNTYPCIACFWEIMKTGIKQIYFKDEHAGYVNDENMEKVASTFGIKITKISVEQ